MIELELKYCLDTLPESIHRLNLLKTKKQTDIYYDTKNYDFLRKGNFLRVRNNKKLEFKIDLGDNSHLFCKETAFELDTIQYNQLDINRIFALIGIPKSPNFTNFEELVAAHELQVIAPINKKRSTFFWDKNCTVSIDEVDELGLFLEVEILIDSENISITEASKIKEHLIDSLISAKILDNHSSSVNIGYVELYLLNHNKSAYNLGKFKL